MAKLITFLDDAMRLLKVSYVLEFQERKMRFREFFGNFFQTVKTFLLALQVLHITSSTYRSLSLSLGMHRHWTTCSVLHMITVVCDPFKGTHKVKSQTAF